MHFFFIILSTIVLFDVLWWVVGARLLRHSRVKWVHALFMSAQGAGLGWLFLGRFSETGVDRWMPKIVVTAVFIWHMLVMPLVLAGLVITIPVWLAGVAIGWIRSRRAREDAKASHPTEAALSRRGFVSLTTAMLPPILTLSVTGVALTQLAQFRVRRFTLRLKNLPQELDGLTIAQVSDMHVGRFTSGGVLQEMVRTVNELKADLVLHTGDLINDELADLDHGIDLVRAMQGRYGKFLIEGNHDLIENPSEFERRMKASGIPFLFDESQVITVRGAPLQILGVSWTRAYQNRDVAIANSVNRLLQQRQPDAFPILLAHHPHAFDAAAAALIPLTLSGHTHGGQLMLNEREGFGPALFRYWSGVYERGESKLVVSNGVGNWFPLRTNAPAEIVHLTLQAG